jgi:hypothetical protein
MELTATDVKHALRTLWGTELTDEEAESMRSHFPAARDLLYHLLANPPPSQQSSSLRKLLETLTPPVQRNCLQDSGGGQELAFAKDSLLRKLRLELFETQKELAAALGTARRLELAVENLKQRVASVASSTLQGHQR